MSRVRIKGIAHLGSSSMHMVEFLELGLEAFTMY
jgi:hypothetical protein